MNFCGYFTGQVNVFGREQDKATLEVLKLIEGALNPSDPTKIHPELVGMESADQYSQVAGGNVQLDDQNKQTFAWVVLCLSICVFTAGVWYFFLRSEKQGDTGTPTKSTGQSGWRWNPFGKHGGGHHKMPYDPEEMSIGPSFENEASVASYRDDRLFVTDRRPAYKDYDGSSSYDDQEEDIETNDIL